MVQVPTAAMPVSDIALDKFVLRERHIKSLLSAVDAFVSPSEFLKQRYVEWGLAEGLISVIPNGQPQRPSLETRQVERGKPVFGYFGNLNPWKGATVLLEAARQLISEGFDFELRVHGAAPFQSESFVSEIERLFAETYPFVQRRGAYRRDDIAQLIQTVDCAIMPSIWWKTLRLSFRKRRDRTVPSYAAISVEWPK